jgi:hypothetical protein
MQNQELKIKMYKIEYLNIKQIFYDKNIETDNRYKYLKQTFPIIFYIIIVKIIY